MSQGRPEGARAASAPELISCCTSAATMRPPGPVPLASATSTPASRASFRAYGLAMTLPPSCTHHEITKGANIEAGAAGKLYTRICDGVRTARFWGTGVDPRARLTAAMAVPLKARLAVEPPPPSLEAAAAQTVRWKTTFPQRRPRHPPCNP